MRCVFAGVVLWGCVGSSQSAQPPELDPGGVSIDFAAAGQEVQTVGESLIRNGGFEEIDPDTGAAAGWRNAFHVYTGDQGERDQVTAKLSGHARRFLSDDNPRSGATCAVVAMPTGAYKEHSKPKPDFSSYFSQYCPLPDLTQDTKYIARFRYRGYVESGTPQGRIRLAVNFLDQRDKPWRGKKTRGHLQQLYDQPTREWKTGVLLFVAPKDTRCLRLDLVLHGYGKIAFDDVELYQVPIEAGVTMLLMPFGMLDDLFAVSSGDVGLLRFAFRNETGKKLTKVHALLELPASIRMLDVRSDQTLLESTPVPEADPPVVRHRIDYSRLKHTISKEGYAAYHSLSCMVTTELPPADTLLQARYWVEDDHGASMPRSFRIKVSPPVHGERPKRFKTAAMFSRDGLYENDEAVTALADFYVRCGFTSVHLQEGKLSLALAERGVDRYIQPFYLCNGYRIGAAKKPDHARFQFVDGTYHNRAICPVEVYQRGEYFTEHVVNDYLRELLVTTRQADHIMPNWEPYGYDAKGCFCERCREEFRKYSGLAAQELAQIWPDSVIMKHRDLYIRFRSWQHAQLMVTIEQAVNELGKEAGIESHFIPEVAWSALTPDGGKLHPGFRNYWVLDYAADLPWLEPWGPYNWFKMEYAHEYRTGCHLTVLASALVTKRHVAAEIRDPAKRPKLIAFPHGYQGDSWVTEPEALAFETLCYFLGGWEGSFAYYFPRGYDARYWREQARTNALIAAHEDLVMDGTRSEKHSFELATPTPALQPNGALKHLGWQDEAIVQCLGFEGDGKRLYAVVNAWEKAACFATLKVTGLGPGERYVLHEPDANRCYAAGPGPTMTGEELARGGLLHTGALRVAFFVVEPFDERVDYGRVVRPAAMQAALEQRLPAIEKAMAFEKAHAELRIRKESVAVTLPDYSNIRAMKAGELACTPVVPDRIGSRCIEFKSPTQTVLVDPAHGGRVASWRVGALEVVNQSEKLGLGVDAVWWPKKAAAFLNAAQRVVDQKGSADGLVVTLERKLGEEAKALKGMTLRKTIGVPVAGAGFTLTTELINTSEAEHEFSFRYHNTTSYLAFVGGEKGRATMSSDSGESVFERRFLKEFYRYGTTPDARLEKAFTMENRKTISSHIVTFSCPWSAVKVRTIPDPEKLHAIIYWDSDQQECATFEPLFKVATLKPGETWSTSVRWEAK